MAFMPEDRPTAQEVHDEILASNVAIAQQTPIKNNLKQTPT
jgi:hypothetical protein